MRTFQKKSTPLGNIGWGHAQKSCTAVEEKYSAVQICFCILFFVILRVLAKKSAIGLATHPYNLEAGSAMSTRLQNLQLQCSRHALAVGRIRSAAVRHMPLQNLKRRAIDRASGVVEEQLLLLSCHLPEEIARLLPVIVL